MKKRCIARPYKNWLLGFVYFVATQYGIRIILRTQFSQSQKFQQNALNWHNNTFAFNMIYKAISIDKEIMGGTPVFYGTRVPIQTLFDYMEGGDSLYEFLEDYPWVSKQAAIEVMEMAQKSLLTEISYRENIA